MTQADMLYLMRKPQLDDLAVNEYGDRAYGTPESTLWNDAYERARARIEHPRYMAPGITVMGQSGNLDSPERVNEQIFKPLEDAFRPETTADRALAQRDLALQAQIAHQQALERQTAERMGLTKTEFESKQADRVARRNIPKMSMGDYQELKRLAKDNADLSATLRDPSHVATDIELKQRDRILKRMHQLQPGIPNPAMTAPNFSPAPVALPTAPTSPVIRYRLVNGQLVQ